VLGAAVLSVVVAAIFAGMLELPRPIYLVFYFASMGLLLYGYLRWSGVDLCRGVQTCTSFSKTTLSGMRGRWQPSGCSSFLLGRRTQNCCQIGSMMYGGAAGMERLLHIGELRELPE
jgi:hypothetical protein